MIILVVLYVSILNWYVMAYTSCQGSSNFVCRSGVQFFGETSDIDVDCTVCQVGANLTMKMLDNLSMIIF